MILSMGATLREAMPPPMRSAKLLRLCIIMVSLIHSYTDRACGGGGGSNARLGGKDYYRCGFNQYSETCVNGHLYSEATL